MELCGRNLKTVIQRIACSGRENRHRDKHADRGAEIEALGVKMLDCISAVHSAGVLHGDVRLENFVTRGTAHPAQGAGDRERDVLVLVRL